MLSVAQSSRRIKVTALTTAKPDDPIKYLIDKLPSLPRPS